MEENTPPTDNPLEAALKQMQAWFVNGEFEKVKQGCQEVLNASPNNSIAQDLLKKAEEALGNTGQAAAPNDEPAPPEASAPITPAEPAPSFEPAPAGSEEVQTAPAMGPEASTPVDIPGMTPESTPEPMHEDINPTTPEETLQPEPEAPIPETIIPEPGATAHEESEHEEHHKLHSLLVNIAILIGLIVLGIAGVYGYQAFFNNNSTPTDVTPVIDDRPHEEELPVIEEDEVSEEDATTEDTEVSEDETSEEEPIEEEPADTAEARDNQRMNDLSSIENALILYYDEHKQYPNVDEINAALLAFMDEIPAGPSDGEVYFYAVYDNNLGPQQVYILSAEFENGEIWATGGNTFDNPSYHDLANDNVTLLHESMTEEEYIEWLENKPEEVVVEEETEISEDETPEEEGESDRERVPRT